MRTCERHSQDNQQPRSTAETFRMEADACHENVTELVEIHQGSEALSNILLNPRTRHHKSCAQKGRHQSTLATSFWLEAHDTIRAVSPLSPNELISALPLMSSSTAFTCPEKEKIHSNTFSLAKWDHCLPGHWYQPYHSKLLHSCQSCDNTIYVHVILLWHKESSVFKVTDRTDVGCARLRLSFYSCQHPESGDIGCAINKLLNSL